MSPSGANPRPAAFLDRDGVINIDHGYVHRREDFAFVPGVLEGARRLHDLGLRSSSRPISRVSAGASTPRRTSSR